MNSRFYKSVFTALFLVALILGKNSTYAQQRSLQWAKDGYHYYTTVNGAIVEMDIRNPGTPNVLVSREALTPAGRGAINVRRFSFSDDRQKILINTNTKRVWRYDTRGDYWVYDLNTKTLSQLGKGRPASSLMFAKISPDGTKAAYVSEHNVYVEDLAGGTPRALTTDGTQRLINGTFDWAYEEEFDCRDGFRWSPDSRHIAYWQIDASKIRNYLMLNTTDSAYSYTVPVEYPVAGTDPSSCKLKVVNVADGQTITASIPGDAVQHYIPRMEWANNSNELILQQLDRTQTQSRIFICNISSNASRVIYQEQDKAWIDAKDDPIGWNWIQNGKKFIWLTEKDGWRHAYSIDRFGKATLLTPGNYDVVSLQLIDEAHGYIYFIASPENAAQRYLYRVKLSGSAPQRVTPANQPGTHSYDISPNGLVAIHSFNNSYTSPVKEQISLPDHKLLSGELTKINADPARAKNGPEFFTVTTADGIKMDGWMMKPANFDASKKYPVVFYVYGEPASQTAADTWGAGRNFLYGGDMAQDGYIYVSMDNRGAPVPKGREWRKAIYRNIGQLNIRDQAMGAKALFAKNSFIDTSRVAVWGWSGGGSSTLNLMFQYPEIYKTGIAIAAVGNQLSYDNIYQERYMGVPTNEEGRSYFVKGSPITYAKNLRGNLLYIHGTGDDNVHYSNAEQLINQLIKYNKQFQLMSYPNRTHSISEGEGTSQHLSTLYTQYLREHCPPGAR